MSNPLHEKTCTTLDEAKAFARAKATNIPSNADRATPCDMTVWQSGGTYYARSTHAGPPRNVEGSPLAVVTVLVDGSETRP